MNVNVGSVVLNGQDSRDANGDEISYLWEIITSPSGSQASLDDVSLVTPTLSFNLSGTYQVKLVVNDGEKNSEANIVEIIVSESNSQPVANAGKDIYGITNSSVTLEADASFDSDNDTLSYRWFFSSLPPASNASLVASDSKTPSFVPDKPGSYMLSLIVNDGKIDSDIDSLIVFVVDGNKAPGANAGLDQRVDVNTKVTLNGIDSYDENGDELSYAWTLTSPEGSTATLG